MSVRERLEAHAAACRDALAKGVGRPELPADLRDLRGADLRWAGLRWSDLRGADLREATLLGAYLDGAYLDGATLRRANLLGATLRGAKILGADLGGAYLGGVTLPDDCLPERIESRIFSAWRVGPVLIYGCETHPIATWPLEEAAARHPHEPAAHAEVRAIVERLMAERGKS